MHLYCIYVSSRLDLSCLPLLHSTVLRGPIKTKNVWKTGRSPWFLGSMLPQYMSLSVCFVLFVLFVCLFRQKFYLSKRPSSYCLIHFGVSSGAARRRMKTFSTVRIRMSKLAWVSTLQLWAQHNHDKTRNKGLSVNFEIWYFKQYTDGTLWPNTTE